MKPFNIGMLPNSNWPVTKDITERAQNLLKKLVEAYIREGQPVGSRILARDSGLDLSAATIRNVMADLEELGLVTSPHTSSGRVPTAKGYRLFIDSLLTMKPIQSGEVERLRHELQGKNSIENIMDTVSGFLSTVTHMAGIVTIPKREYSSLRHVEFLVLSDGRVLAILVVNESEVQNRILTTKKIYSESELRQVSNYLNASFAGVDISSVRRRLLEEMRETKQHMDVLMEAAIEISEHLFSADHAPADYVLAGETNLMDFHELSDLEKLRKLFEAFGHKRDILHLFDQCLAASGVQIFIGEESGYQVLGNCSIVTAPYEVDGKVLGVLGVIGPTRMAYEKVIPIVDMTAKMLGLTLNDRS